MRLEQLRYFIEIVENKSFNKASTKLYITQPALTSAIKALEDEIGYELLARGAKGVVPTTRGWKVYDDAKAFLGQFSNMVASWRPEQLDRQELNQVHILAIPAICSWLLESALPLFQREYPDIKIILEDAIYLDFIERFHASRANISLTMIIEELEEEWLTQFAAKGLKTHFLLEDEFVLIMGAAHPLAKKTILSAEDVKNIKMLSYSYTQGSPQDLTPKVLNEIGIETMPHLYLNNRETIMRTLEHGEYVTAWLEKMMKSHWTIKEGKLVMKRVANKRVFPVKHFLAHLDERLLTGAEKIFIDWIKKNYKILAEK